MFTILNNQVCELKFQVLNQIQEKQICKKWVDF